MVSANKMFSELDETTTFTEEELNFDLVNFNRFLENARHF